MVHTLNNSQRRLEAGINLLCLFNLRIQLLSHAFGNRGAIDIGSRHGGMRSAEGSPMGMNGRVKRRNRSKGKSLRRPAKGVIVTVPVPQ